MFCIIFTVWASEGLGFRVQGCTKANPEEEMKELKEMSRWQPRSVTRVVLSRSCTLVRGSHTKIKELRSLLEGSWVVISGYKSPNMGYKYGYPTYNPTYNSGRRAIGCTSASFVFMWVLRFLL